MESKPLSRHEQIKDWAAAIQSVVVAIAVLVGGVWTLHTFTSLKQRERAEAELTKAKLRSWLDLQLKAEALPTPEYPHLYRITATVKNNGSRTVRLNYEKPRPLTIYTVELVNEAGLPWDANDKLAHPTLQAKLKERRKYPFIGFDNEPSKYSFIEPQESYEFEFLASLERPGLYHVIFHAFVDDQQFDDLKAEARVEKDVVNVKHFIHVPPAGSGARPSPSPSEKKWLLRGPGTRRAFLSAPAPRRPRSPGGR